MAACCTTTVVAGSSCSPVFLSNGRPQMSSLFYCCARVRQRTSFGRLGGRLVLTKETSREQRRRSRGQSKFRMQLQTDSSSPSIATEDSSDPATAEFEAKGDGSESLMSIEEKNAAMVFEGLTSTDSIPEKEEEEGGSDVFLESSSEEEEERKPPIDATETSEDVVKMQPRSSPRKSAMRHGASIASIITLFVGLLERPSTGDGKLLAGAGSAVLERVEEEVDKLRAVEDVDGQHLFEILRVVKLLQMDLQLVAAARKESTMSDRLNQTKAHCRQLLNIATIL